MRPRLQSSWQWRDGSTLAGGPLRQSREQGVQSRPRHGAGPGQSEDIVGGDKTAFARSLPHRQAQGVGSQQSGRSLAVDPPQDARGLDRGAQSPHAELWPNTPQQRADAQAQVKMFMCIDVIDCEAGGGVQFELRVDLRRNLLPNVRPRKDVERKRKQIAPKPSCRIDQVGDRRGRQGGMSVDQDQMQADLQRRQPPGPTDSVLLGRTATMRLADVRMPSRWAISTASLTSGARPKSSAVTINLVSGLPRAAHARTAGIPDLRATGAS